MGNLVAIAALTRDTLEEFAAGLTQLAQALDEELHAPPPPDPSLWHFPIGTDEYPPADWYVALLHDTTGKRNVALTGRVWPHTGVDYNLAIPPFGDVDRGMPVWAIANGVIYGTWHSTKNLGSVAIRVQHGGKPLWVRYWHLNRDHVFLAHRPGNEVGVGECLGHLGNYRGGDHVHFDMALDAFHPGVWFTNAPETRWIDPIPVLKAHLDPAEVEASLRK